jgi:quinohemoprotein ethanol dehydrogenase
LNQSGLSELLAWDPVRQKQVWRLKTGGPMGAGILATGGGLIFQGRGSGGFYAYDATTGKVLWRVDLGVPVMAPPITYVAGGRQYVTVLTGISTSMAFRADLLPFSVDYYTQPRRVLTFAIGGKENVPSGTPYAPQALLDPAYKPNAASEARGGELYGHCITCHGINAVSGGSAPDLRASGVPTSPDAFAQVVRDGALVAAGMPRFEELSDADLADLRRFIQAKAHLLRAEQSLAQAPGQTR